MSYWHLTWVAPKLGLLNNLICDLWHTGYWYIFNITTTNTNKKNLLKVLLIQNRRRWVRVWVRVNETRPFSTFWSVCCHRITCTTTFLTFMVRNVWLSEWKENCHWGCGPCSYFESKESVVHSKIYPRICSFWKIEPRSRAQARPSAPVSPKTRLRPRSVVTWLSVAQIVSKASLVFSS